MLLTCFYMMATIVQAWTKSLLKTRLHNIFKGDRSLSSIMFHNKISKEELLEEKDYKINTELFQTQRRTTIQDESFINFHLCLEKETARLGELLWLQGDIKLCTICPQQRIDLSDWLAYPHGKSSFPLHTNNSCQISGTPDQRINVLVEAVFGTLGSEASTVATKLQLEDYGLIRAWTTIYPSMNLILETDIDRVTNLIFVAIQGQHYINNNLLLTRVQSLSVLGEPCTYDDEVFSEVSTYDEDRIGEMEWYIAKVTALSVKAREAYERKESTFAELSNVNVYPKPILETFQKHRFLEEAKSSELYVPTNSSTSAVEDLLKHDVETVRTMLEASATSSNLASSDFISNNLVPSHDSTSNTLTPSSDVTNKKDNTLSNTNNEISSKSQNKSKESEKTPKAASIHYKLKEERKYNKIIKPPNVVIYADSPDAINNVKTVLEKALDLDRYIIYVLSRETARSNVWIDQTVLVVVCGNVDSDVKAQLVEYVIHGGKLLALCSDLLHTLLPSFKTAEVRESELVHFSYGKWKHVRMMHDIFCYHASPVRTRFSQDHEDIRTPVLHPPASASVKDKRGNSYSFDVKVLGTEETWHNPSILLATLANSGGKVVFSQIHLEIDPMQYEYEEDKFNALKKSNAARLEIIIDLLNRHLGMEINRAAESLSAIYTPAYFLGTFEAKLKVIEKLKKTMQANDILKLPNLDIQFCTSSSTTPTASASFLPILPHSCPADFSTVDYFESLTTKELGRLVIYTDVLTSSMYITEYRLEHGLAIIPRQQTKGQGRGQNVWLSPMGCAMFTLQIHIPKKTYIGSHISILQHYVGVAIIATIRAKSDYENIDLRLKWPNDIYVGSSTKIGGLIIQTQSEEALYICNIGVGVNLSNSKPTTCINDIIREYNEKYGTKLREFSYEKFLAEVFNNLETLIYAAYDGSNMNHFRELYHKYWLHENESVTVVKQNGDSEDVTIVDIDDFGFLLVKGKKSNIFGVHPDGNSFDLIKGLITPK